MNRILVIEDDYYLRRNLKEILVKNNFQVVTASSVGEAVHYVQTDDEIDLYLLDIWLPDGEGFTICKEIRKRNHRPIIFLSVCEEEEAVVKGLNMGGDDYVVKPYRTKELLSRIQANLRKNKNKNLEKILKSNDLILDKKQGYVIRQGQAVRLTPVELELLGKLMENAECIVSREQLMTCLSKDDYEGVEDNTLSVNMSRLRGKLGNEYIETVRGFGYRFVGKVHKEIYE